MRKKQVFILAVFALFGTGLSVHAQTVTHSNNPNAAILPDNGCIDDTNGTGGGGITDTIAFTETTAALTDVNVRVEITTTWRSDVQMALSYTGGGGTAVLANNHDTSGDNYFATFDSESGNGPCSAAANCGTGTNCTTAPGPTCQPNQPLTAFNGLATPGTFTLALCDRAAADSAALVLWEVTATGVGLPVELQGFTVE